MNRGSNVGARVEANIAAHRKINTVWPRPHEWVSIQSASHHQSLHRAPVAQSADRRNQWTVKTTVQDSRPLWLASSRACQMITPLQLRDILFVCWSTY